MKKLFSLKNVLYAISFVCLVIALVSGAVYLKEKISTDKNLKAVEELKNSAVSQTDSVKDSTQSTEEQLPSPLERKIDWEMLKSANEDIYAWIYIPGTEVDYPLFQSAPGTDDDYYLSHNMDRSEGTPGVLYTEWTVNGKDFTDKNTLVLGHNFNNDTMFSSLHRYRDKDFYNYYKNIYIYTPEKVLTYRIFAAYITSNIHPLKGIDISTDEKYGEYLASIFTHNGENDNIDRDVEIKTTDRIITLLTCTLELDPEYRYYVQGVLVE